jgi:4-hydroxy-3-methylbut-2-enyl diphosphate reductase
MQNFNILLANPRGFCAGVDRAVTIVEKALEQYGPPIYVRHEVVHNRYVVENLAKRGVIFTDDLNDIPQGSHVIFSAHGVSEQTHKEAKARNLQILDATCPLVTKVHLEVKRYARLGYECILIGHAGHPEVEGTLGQYDAKTGKIYLIQTLEDVADLQVQDPEKIAYVTQTTLSIDETAKIVAALKEKYPLLLNPKKEDICYATQNRQDAVKLLAKKVDVMIVVGSTNSSNSNRLKELAESLGKPAYLIDEAEQLCATWVENKQNIGITAGASAPEILVQAVVEKLRQLGGKVQEIPGIQETISFSLPRELRGE